MKRVLRLAAFWSILTLLTTPLAVNVLAQDEVIEVSVYEGQGSSLAGLLEGEVGAAHLFYYSPEKGINRPLLVVRLTVAEEGTAVAEVFDVPDGSDRAPVEFVDGYPHVLTGIVPTLVLNAVGGWWIREGITNYNLDIIVNGQVSSMWGSTLDAKGGPQYNWPLLLAANEPNTQIKVRDTDNDGIPDWDWRTMLAEFRDRGDLRTNYAERKCDSPVTVDPGVSPEWPYVALDGGFEQEVGTFRPPIVVDWQTGRIKNFSELVTVRNQNCSYALYSIERVLPGQLNSPNFESPFAFYDLSGKGVGYPNLIVRTARSIEDEPLLTTMNPETQGIRYSWRNAIGDWRWDYKIDVHGQYQYDSETRIADGAAAIDAPSYEEIPNWVIGREWPAVSFVAMERQDRSSEGIYDWSMGALAYDYLFGWNETPMLTMFEDIRPGIRGEYRLDSTNRPETYLSPVDNRLHLKWAEHGIWRLDEEEIIRVANLNNDETIDVWSRELMAATGEEDARVEVLDTELSAGQPADSVHDEVAELTPKVVEALHSLNDHFLHANDAGVTLVNSDFEPILFETLPPTDHDTWEAHRALLAPYEDQRRDPYDLRSWLDAFPGPRSEIAGASLENVRILDDGFRFELALNPGFQVAGPDLMGVGMLAPGDYLVENHNDAFTVTPLVPAQFMLDVQQPDEAGHMAPVQVIIHNSGTADSPGLTLVAELVGADGLAEELSRELVDALAGEMTPVLLDIPSSASDAVLQVRLEDATGQIVATSEPAALAPAEPAAPGAIFGMGQVPAVLPVLGLFSVLVAVAALLAVVRRREQVS